MCSARPRASSADDANWMPPAFMRPPDSTCDFSTTSPPISPAMRAASSAVVAVPPFDTGTPALPERVLSLRTRRTSCVILWIFDVQTGCRCGFAQPSISDDEDELLISGLP